MSDIAVVSYGRKQSERCPNKMLRSFCDTTLTDIVLSKISCFGAQAYFAGFEDEFRVKAEAHGVNFVQRTEHSVHIDGPIVDVFGFVKDIDCENILFVSACLPFLLEKTIVSFYESCLRNSHKPALAVVARKNYFFDKHKKALNFDPATTAWNTKVVDEVFESANALYFYKKDFFLANGFYWAWEDVALVPFEQTYEYIDIDSEDDFKKAELIWQIRHRKNKDD